MVANAITSNNDLIANLNLDYPIQLSGFEGILQFDLTGKAGRAEIIIQAKDTAGTERGGMDSASFVLQVNIQQTIPLAEHDTFVVAEDETLVGNIISNDLDEDTEDEDLEVIMGDSTLHGSLEIQADKSFYIYS